MHRRPFELEDLYRLRSVSDPRISPDGSRVAFVVSVADASRDRNASSIWMVPTDGGDPVELTLGPGDAMPRWSPDGDRLAFLRAHDGEAPQVWTLPAGGGEARPITSVRYGVTEFAWSPDGAGIAFVAACDIDEHDTDDTGAPRPIVVNRLRYKADGLGFDRSFRRHLFLTGPTGDEPRRLTEGDFHVGLPVWSPDGAQIAFIAGRHPTFDLDFITDVSTVPAKGGSTRQLTRWKGTASAASWSPDGASLVLVGSDEPQRDTHAKLFVVAAEGGRPRELFPGLDRNVMLGSPGYPGAVPAFTPDGREIFFCARDRGCVHICAGRSDGGATRTIVGGDDRLAAGVTLAPGRMAFLVSTPRIPGDVFSAALDGSFEHRLTNVNRELLDEIEVYQPESRTFRASDGTELHGWVIRGAGEGRAPLLLDIHGGPHNAWAPNFGSNGRIYHQILAGAGWSILLLNSRGSDGYGERFYRALEGGWGRLDMGDFLAAVDATVDEGIADPERLAVTGNSYGGYMTNWIVSHTDRFAAAVPAGSLSNLASFFGTSDLGSFLRFEFGARPYEDPALYAELSPLTWVEEVRTPVLILHGLNDDRVPVSQAEEWFAALRHLGKTVEMVVYPEASHLFPATGRPSHRVDYARRLIAWVTAHASSGNAGSGRPAP